MMDHPEVGIYKRKQERKHAFEQESDQEKRKNGQDIRKKTRSRPIN